MQKFLTYAPIVKRIRSGEYEELSIMVYGLAGTISVKQRFTRTNASVNTYTYTATILGGRFTFVNSIPTGETFSNIKLIEVWAEYQGFQVTEIRTYIPDSTLRKNPVRLGWLNTLGGIDYYTFTGSKAVESFAEKVLYNRDLPVPFNITDRGGSVASTVAFNEVEAISDFETPEVYEWISGLLGSPEVWLAEGTQIQPVIVTTKSHPVVSETLFQFKMKFKLANDKIVQNG